MQSFLDRLRYGKPVVVVSGLPRSGTSMMMKMLVAGGMEAVTDEIRAADEDNPKGYFEYERVKDLDKKKDKSWVRETRGKAIKVISFLLRDLPRDNYYKILFMERDIEEVIASQNKMLKRRGELISEEADEQARKDFAEHLKFVRSLFRVRSNFEVVSIRYTDAIHNPREVAEKVRSFLERRLDVDKMAEVVDESLYRNRIEDPTKQNLPAG